MKTCIIGGSAAGMMAGYSTKDKQGTVIIEANEKLGKKIYITGKGRCNFTNTAEKDVFFKNIVSNPKFFLSAYSALGPSALIALFESFGMKTKIERGNRAFPLSDKSSDVIATLKKMLESSGTEVCLKEKALKILTENGRVKGVLTDKREILCDKVIIAAGGMSYPATGSTGDGYRLAEILGHTVIAPVPALCPVFLDCAYSASAQRVKLNSLPRLEGLSLKNVGLTAFEDGKTVFSDFGEMLFTDCGASGPLVLSLSSYINRKALNKITVSLDLKPALSFDALDARLLRDFSEYKNKDFKNSLDDILPKSLIPFIIKLSEISEYKKVNEITREQRQILVSLFKELRFTVSALGAFPYAVVTAGGVSTKEINPKTMESKLVSGLYFAGEVIDLDALTGGFNLQIAFSTGYLAGIS